MLKEFAQSQPIAMKFYYFLVYCKCKAAFALFSHYILLHVSFLITFRISENLFIFFSKQEESFYTRKITNFNRPRLMFFNFIGDRYR